MRGALVQDRMGFLVKLLLVVFVVQAIALCNFTSKHAGSKAAGCSTGDMV